MIRRAIVILILCVIAGTALAADPAPAVQAPDADKAAAGLTHTAMDARYRDGQAAAATGNLARAYLLLTDLVRDQPDNEQANFALGMTCRALHDISRAQLAFERVLDINPRNDRARLEWARILMEQQNTEAARREFDTVLSHDPPPSVRRNIEECMDQMRREKRRFFLSGRVDVGLSYDDNVNVGPSSGEIYIAPVVLGSRVINTLTIDDDSLPLDASSAFASALVSASYDAGDPGTWLLVSDAALYANQLDNDSAHASRYLQAAVGARRKGDRSTLTLPIEVTTIHYGSDPLVTLYGVAPSVSYLGGAAADWGLITGAALESRDHDTLDDRDGLYVSGNATVKRFCGEQRHAVMLGLTISHDYTDAPAYENTTVTVSTGMDVRLPRQSAIYTRLRYAKSNYAEPEPLAPVDRADRQRQVVLGISKQLSPRWGVDLNAQATRNVSSFDLYTYNRNIVTLSTSILF